MTLRELAKDRILIWLAAGLFLTSIAGIRTRDPRMLAPVLAAAGAYGIYSGGRIALGSSSPSQARRQASAANRPAGVNPANMGVAFVMAGVLAVLLALWIYGLASPSSARADAILDVVAVAGWLLTTTGAEILAWGIMRLVMSRKPPGDAALRRVRGLPVELALCAIGVGVVALGVMLIVSRGAFASWLSTWLG